MDDMEFNVLSNGLVLELYEKGIVGKATVLKHVSRVMIVWYEVNAPLLLQVKVKESIIILARLKVDIVISSDMEVNIGCFD
jgi:hypothetical protein